MEKNKYYHWDKIQRRHWLAMAGLCKFNEEEMDNIIEEVFDMTHRVIIRYQVLCLLISLSKSQNPF